MTDTITCPNCSAQLPAAASFCTNCGNSLSAPGAESTPPPTPSPPGPESVASPAPPVAEPTPPPADSTRVDTPGLHDSTQVYSPPPAATGPWEPAPGIAPAAPPSEGGWGQAQPSSTAPDQPLAPPPGAWGQPAPGGAATWQPQGAPTGQPTTGGGTNASSPIGAAVAVVGGLLAIVGTFLVWVTNNVTDAGLSGWDLTSGDKGFLVGGRLLTLESPDPYIIVGLGAVAVVIGLLLFLGTARNVMRIAAAVAGLAIVGLLARDWTSMASVISDNAPSSFEITAAPGFYLVAAGGVLIALAALIPAKK